MKLYNIIPFVSLILCVSCIKEPVPIEEVKEELPVIDTVIRYDSKNVYSGKGVLINGKRNGKWLYNDDKGEIKKVENYVNDTLEGNYREYHKGKVIHEGVYFKGKKDGEWKNYNNRGRISKVENYINDTLNGVYKEYYYNGNLHLEGLYSKGKKDKKRVYYSKKGIKEKELFYDQDSIVWELQYLASSYLNDQNESKIIRPIYYSTKRPELPYYSVFFNARLDGQLFIDGHKVINLKRGQELELLIREDEYSYSYRYPSEKGIHRMDMQIDSIIVDKGCEEYIILEEDLVINNAIRSRKISELMTYLNNPIEENYNYKWNDNVSTWPSKYYREYRSDLKVDSVLNLVSKKRKEILLSEFKYYLENPIDSNYKEYWKYFLYKTDDVVYDSLKLLAYYTGKKDFLTDSSQILLDGVDYIDTIVVSEIECFPEKNGDTLFINGLSRCLYKYSQIEEFNEAYLYDKELYFQSDSAGVKVLGYDFDLIYRTRNGETSWRNGMMIVFRKDSLDDVFFQLSEHIGYYRRQSFFNSKLTLNGELEVLVRTRVEREVNLELIAEEDYLFFDVDHDVVLNYKLNDDLSLTFKGIRMVELKPLAIQTSW